MGKSSQAKAREFSARDRQKIEERDEWCIFCKMGYHMEDVKGYGAQLKSIMHYIPRSANGLGIPENGALGCQCHHEMLDNGSSGRRDEMRELFREYLMQQYPDWNEEDIVFSKWKGLAYVH